MEKDYKLRRVYNFGFKNISLNLIKGLFIKHLHKI